ncbi:MAG: DUF2089 domain-containing protein [Candidatus Eisenbacteria bacterium]|jgi:hypothetical protein|nr:DUF2089 domain-containing protein [Candidatus Eisenbacteria bacterium]
MHSAVPPHCPSCGATLEVVKLECPVCQTEVAGQYALCPVCRLDAPRRRLFDLYMAARGNVREVQRELGVSYPTARLRIEAMFQELGHGPTPPQPASVLRRLRAGEINVATAERLLRGEAVAEPTIDGQ